MFEYGLDAPFQERLNRFGKFYIPVFFYPCLDSGFVFWILFLNRTAHLINSFSSLGNRIRQKSSRSEQNGNNYEDDPKSAVYVLTGKWPASAFEEINYRIEDISNNEGK